ncbi:aspartic proteinase 36-like [Lotus japonicus]|uniref:aspartic proteinase 36-like n=1 Tax=Lotus japonicus TaxID=34305 RepID=UPI002585C926|nr:aspartic proteinase 36-like [Lotus japonicus]
MAEPSTPLISTVFISVILCLARLGFCAELRTDHDAMILPLHFSVPDSSISPVNPRRQLQRSESERHPNAHMRLYDDLLLNGYYTTRLWIGTPPQKFALIVDTGSTVTYVPCSTCKHCGLHQDPKFQPDKSKTYQPVKCRPGCNCDKDRKQCTYDRQYAELSSSSGVLGEDVVSFGNQSELGPQRAVFGCENVETGDLYSQHADGIIGLGRGDLSIMDQLVGKKVLSNSFSLCYGGMDVGGGAMVLGGISPPADMVFTHSDPIRSPYYNINLKEMHVAGKRLPLNPKVFDGKHGTVLDSGTTYAYLPAAAFFAFKHAIIKELQSLKQISGPDPNYKDICFSGAGSDVSQLSRSFPVVDMVFENGHKLALSPENYLFPHSKVRGAYCLGVFSNGKDPTTLLGGIVVRNTLVIYDREHTKVGFLKTNCSELWARLHVSDALPPVPPNSEGTNLAKAFEPSVAPSASQFNIHQGELQIAQITIVISFNISYMDMKPHITELADLIAHELDVNTSQVHLMNFSSLGNGSLSRWVITPRPSANFFSNTTAMSMISRISEHQLQLPDKFGSYNLVDWHAKPPSKRTWWQQYFVVAALAVLLTLLLGASAFGIFLIWKNKQHTEPSYKPVDVVVPEQELQPL